MRKLMAALAVIGIGVVAMASAAFAGMRATGTGDCQGNITFSLQNRKDIAATMTIGSGGRIAPVKVAPNGSVTVSGSFDVTQGAPYTLFVNVAWEDGTTGGEPVTIDIPFCPASTSSTVEATSSTTVPSSSVPGSSVPVVTSSTVAPSTTGVSLPNTRPTLPRTGSSDGNVALVALAAITAGVGLLIVARRNAAA